jgi:hypothetical protein
MNEAYILPKIADAGGSGIQLGVESNQDETVEDSDDNEENDEDEE